MSTFEAELGQDIKWRDAKTYRRFAPHEYILQEDYPEIFARWQTLLNEQGVNEKFTFFGHTKDYRYFYTDNHRYWIMGNVLNRDARFAKTSRP